MTIYKWETAEAAEDAINLRLRPERPDWTYGPVVPMQGGFAVIATAPNGLAGFVAEVDGPPPGGPKPAKRNRAWEFLIWALLGVLLVGAAAEYFKLWR